MNTRFQSRLAAALLGAGLLMACSENPVTGKRELHLVSQAQEVQIGEENYAPSQQSQGGAYTVDPGLSRYVNEVGQKLAKVSDRPDLPYEFVVLNNSVPNAWALPGGKIAVNRGLLYHLESEAELAAVLGHEIVHAAARHGAKSMERGILMQVGVAAIGVAAANNEYSNLIVGGAALGSQLISTKYGRDAELESDNYGMEYLVRAGYDPAAAIKLQETFVKLAEGKESNWLEGLFASHPPSRERVEANRVTAAKLQRPGLTMGVESYRKQLKTVLASKPAYDKYTQGQAALQKKDYRKATALAEEAIALERREGLFYELMGDVQLQQEKFPEAQAQYTQALQRNPDYFSFHLKRGLANQRLGDKAAAQADYESSIKRLPTALAHYQLGVLAEGRGEKAKAIENYAVVAQTQGDLGKQAATGLVRLDLVEHPEKYVEITGGFDKSGKFVLQLANQTPVDITGIVVEVVTDRAYRISFDSPLPAGKAAQFTPQVNVTSATGVKARVVAAAPVK